MNATAAPRTWHPAALAHRLQRSLLAWPLAAVAAVVVLVLNEVSHERSVQALERLGQRAVAMTQIPLVERRLMDAETGQRGYLLTGRRLYLAPYEAAAADTRVALDWLHTHHAQEPVMAARLTALREHTQARLQELARTVAAYDADPATPLAPLLGPPQGGHLDAVHRLTAELTQAEQRQIAQERRAVFSTLHTSRIGVNLAALAGLLALALVLRQSRALDAAQREHAQALHDERARLETEVTRRTEDLSALARHLQTAREDERSRLAGNLQNELGALLTATQLDVMRLRHELPPAATEARARLDHLAQSIERGISLKRRIIEDLRPSSLANLGLASALEIQAREFGERAGVAVHTELAEVALSEAAQITAYRLVQEALTNAAKYAQARHVTVTLKPHGDAHEPRVRVGVQDDGRGFDTRATPRRAHGLMGMRYRVEAVGGRLRIESAPGRGTCIEAELPALLP